MGDLDDLAAAANEVRRKSLKPRLPKRGQRTKNQKPSAEVKCLAAIVMGILLLPGAIVIAMRDPPPSMATGPVVDTDAASFLLGWRRTAQAAVTKYDSQSVQIAGLLEQVNPGAGTIETSGGGKSRIFCDVAGDDKLSRLRAGRIVTVRGMCTPMDVSENVRSLHCAVVGVIDRTVRPGDPDPTPRAFSPASSPETYNDQQRANTAPPTATVHVREYRRKDGTLVHSYDRSK